jgi:hypothetical protein
LVYIASAAHGRFRWEIARTGLSEGILYHIDNKKPLTEHLFRAGSQKYFDLWAEARMLYSRDLLEVKGDD